MPNLLCEWIFPSDAPLSATYDWIHASDRPGMTDFNWHHINYARKFDGLEYRGVEISVQFLNLNPWLKSYELDTENNGF